MLLFAENESLSVNNSGANLQSKKYNQLKINRIFPGMRSEQEGNPQLGAEDCI
jgi:hypothetical protein